MMHDWLFPFHTVLLAVMCGLWVARLRRLYRHVRGFRTVSRGKLILRYDPSLERRWDLAVLLERCQAALDSLAKQFGFSLRGRVRIYMCRDIATVSKMHGSPVGGFALVRLGAIVLADNSFSPELLRHELGHLFAVRWNAGAPPLFSEGLAVWLQQTHFGQSFAAAARPLLAQRDLKLRLLLRRRFFYAEPHRAACYALAGSFTDFLIRRHGWERYRRFYRQSSDLLFGWKFKRCFGVSLEKAEWQWRNELVLMEIFNRRLGRSALS